VPRWSAPTTSSGLEASPLDAWLSVWLDAYEVG
jgi:hypothetical protein